MKLIKSNKWTSILWVVFILNSVVFSLLLFAINGEKETAGVYGLRFLKFDAWQDSWGPMYQAIEHLREHPDVPIYTELFFNQKTKFQYPLSSLVPLDLFQQATDIAQVTLFKVLNIVSWIFVILTGGASWLILRESQRKETGSDEITLASLIPVLAITITFYPLAKSYTLGQIQTTITFFVALAILAWQWKKPWVSGILLGACSAIKPQWGVVILWGLLRKEWKFVITSSLTFGILTLIAMGMYGFQNYLDYLPAVSFMGQRGESYFPNQSVNGLVNRLLFNGDNLKWHADSFPPYNPTVYGITVISALLLLGFALIWKMNKKANAFDLSLLILSLTISSPIAWEHHFGVLIPIFALIAPICVSQKVAGKYTVPILSVAFFLTSQRLDFTRMFADTYFNFLQSYLFFGAITVLWLLYRITKSRLTSTDASQ